MVKLLSSGSDEVNFTLNDWEIDKIGDWGGQLCPQRLEIAKVG
jgi:hypothetical protein